MIRLDFFRAIAPTDDYPVLPFPLYLWGVEYDLPLASCVADELADLLSLKGPFRRLEHHCSPVGIELLRSCPSSFQPECEYAAYAESRTRFNTQTASDRLPVAHGYALLQAAGNALAAEEVIRRAVEGKHFGAYSQEWFKQNAAFLQYSGGFEIVRMFFYLNFSELDEVDSFLDGPADDQHNATGMPMADNLKIFREMLAQVDAR